MTGIEKFKFDLHQLLKDEGLLPEGKAELILKMNVRLSLFRLNENFPFHRFQKYDRIFICFKMDL